MISKDKILKETSPLSILLVKSGSGGNRLLFRYPYEESQFDNASSTEDSNVLLQQTTTEADRIQLRNIISEDDATLCNIFSVHPNLCGQKFEIKINNVRHVGHPMSLLQKANSSLSNCPYNVSDSPARHTDHRHYQKKLDTISQSVQDANDIRHGDITSFNIVLALRSSVSYDIVDCYYDLSKRLAIALSFEERRCCYLAKEIRTMLAALDECEMANLENHDILNSNSNSDQLDKCDKSNSRMNNESVFNLILKRSSLAADLKRIFLSLCTTGIVDLKVNGWVSVSFCLPQKVHRLKLITHQAMPAISDKDIKRCLTYLRPYHGFLLLQEPKELLDSLPIDASPAFIQLIRVANPEKNFMDMSVDANVTLMQIYCIVSQLVYWAKVTIIYPICDSNIYAIHPLASTGIRSQLVKDFKNRFPKNKPLVNYLADFSEGTSLSQLNIPLLKMEEKANLSAIVTWLLQRRILTQIHKYIFLIGNIHSISANKNHDDYKLLMKLLPHFDGKHHIEDIMFFENLERSQILILCDKFRHILYTCHYEDVAVSQLSPFDK